MNERKVRFQYLEKRIYELLRENEDLYVENEKLKELVNQYDEARLSKHRRKTTILIQLAYDYLDYLELFENEETVKRQEQVRNILERMELTYAASTETEPQPESTEKKRPDQLLKQDYWRDN